MMKKKQCKAYAGSTKVQCSFSALPSSRYCGKHQDPAPWIISIIIGIAISALFYFIGLHNARTQETERISQEELEKNRARPKVGITITDSESGRIDITVKSGKSTGNTIESLSFQLDIPGIFERSVERPSERAGIHRAFSSLLAGSNGEVIAETALINCYAIDPGGHCSFSLFYKPTEPRVLEHGDFKKVYHPLMDLHDKSRYYFHWTYKGVGLTESGYLDFSHLTYIQNDNENLKKTMPSAYPDDEAVKRMEEKRKNWY